MNIAAADIFDHGGAGGLDLAEKTAKLADSAEGHYKTLYELNMPVEDKIFTVASEIYGAVSVTISPGQAEPRPDQEVRLRQAAVCIAKTQQSLSDNPSLLGLPRDFIVTVREIKIAAGAGFLIPITGEILRMPGLSKMPAAYGIDIDDDGNISGIMG
jgi:formate--tetrahydrofolate ligase